MEPGYFERHVVFRFTGWKSSEDRSKVVSVVYKTIAEFAESTITGKDEILCVLIYGNLHGRSHEETKEIELQTLREELLAKGLSDIQVTAEFLDERRRP